MELFLAATVVLAVIVQLLPAAGAFSAEDDGLPSADELDRLHEEVLPAEAADADSYEAMLRAQRAEQAAAPPDVRTP